MAKGLRAMSLDAGSIPRVYILRNCFSANSNGSTAIQSTHWDGLIRSRLQVQLEELIANAASDRGMLLINGPPPFGVDVSRFLALKRLSVPLPYLTTRPINPSPLALSRPLYKRLRFESNPSQVLPKSFESILSFWIVILIRIGSTL